MRESVSGFLKEQRLPVIITAFALLLAVAVGLVPLMDAADEPANGQSGTKDEVAALEARLTALEAAGTDGNGGMSPALRAELDLISKGLLNQTGRVSRLKKQIAAPGEDGDAMDPALRGEIDLIAKGLLNQTGRVSTLKKQVQSLSTLPGQVKRIDLEVINLTKAVSQLHRRLRNMTPEGPPAADELTELRSYLSEVQTQVDGVRESLASVTEQLDATVAAGADKGGSLTAIEAKLDQILRSMTD